MILSHVSVGTTNIIQAVAFYDAVMATLAIQRSHYIEGIAASYGDKFEFWVGCPPCEHSHSPSIGHSAHVAFNAPSNSAVDAFYQAAIEQGGTCEGKPGLRPQYGATYYAAYVRDLEGNKIEALSI